MNPDIYIYGASIFAALILIGIMLVFREQIIKYVISKKWIHDSEELFKIIYEMRDEVYTLAKIVEDGKVTQKELDDFVNMLSNKYIDIDQFVKYK